MINSLFHCVSLLYHDTTVGDNGFEYFALTTKKKTTVVYEGFEDFILTTKKPTVYVKKKIIEL